MVDNQIIISLQCNILARAQKQSFDVQGSKHRVAIGNDCINHYQC